MIKKVIFDFVPKQLSISICSCCTSGDNKMTSTISTCAWCHIIQIANIATVISKQMQFAGYNIFNTIVNILWANEHYIYELIKPKIKRHPFKIDHTIIAAREEKRRLSSLRAKRDCESHREKSRKISS